VPRLRPGTPVIAVAYATQVVDHVPTTARDVPVPRIVTEDETIVTASAAVSDGGAPTA
jgi:5-formyltetrahydrofolate cyclo-ligase